MDAFERHSRAGIDLWKESRFFEAKAEFAQALRERPGSAHALAYLAHCNFEVGDKTAAIEGAKKAASMAPNARFPQFVLGRILRLAGQPGEAKVPLTRARELSPERADYIIELGLCELALGDVESASLFASEALAIEPDSKPAREILRSVKKPYGGVRLSDVAKAAQADVRASWKSQAESESAIKLDELVEHLEIDPSDALARRRALVQVGQPLKQCFLIIYLLSLRLPFRRWSCLALVAAGSLGLRLSGTTQQPYRAFFWLLVVVGGILYLSRQAFYFSAGYSTQFARSTLAKHWSRAVDTLFSLATIGLVFGIVRGSFIVWASSLLAMLPISITSVVMLFPLRKSKR